ncbi:MAG: HAMP domain-containing protein [Blastocatellia bacterium]|nr:HAMP domain-containing protein [Blastocatellia bacterium]
MKEKAPKQSRLLLMILGVLVFGLLILLILFQSSNLWKDLSVDSASDTLLLYGLSSLNVAAFVIFGFIFLRSLVKLMRERRTLQLGSKIKSRLFFYFALVSILPIVAMAVFSYLFLNRALDRWFTQIPENVVREAREVQNKSNAEQFTRLQETANMIAASLDGRPVSEVTLEQLVKAGDLAYAEILDEQNRPIVSTRVDPARPEIALIRSGRFDDPALRDGVGIDAATAVLANGHRLIIAPNLRDTESVSLMVDDSLSEFDRLKGQQATVRQIGFLTLGVLTFLLIFASSWTAFYIARGLTVPIKALAEGAEKIARGDLGHRVDVLAEDELALLVWTFNDMSGKLEANAAELTERRRYIETVLLSLPTGVISVDSEGLVSTINPSARSILRLERVDILGTGLLDHLGEADRTIFERVIARAKRIGHASEQTKLALPVGNGGISQEGSPISLTATALPENSGVVLVIEDLSELIAAQRASAWQEVARRMAHEIKNPLTPIQLSAERIAKRASTDPEASGSGLATTLIREGTDTILREVQSLKAMVDEFSRFARLPDARLELGSVNTVVNQAAELYKDRGAEILIELNLSADLPAALIDHEQLKRVFVNLIDNAIEAPTDEPAKTVTITSRHENARDLIVVEISDNGNGIDPGDYQKLFQPYFSTKGRGTGLGLAIVNRIVTEHHGKIKAVPNQPKGARFIVELPLAA